MISSPSWTLTSTIRWGDPSTSIPVGASQAMIEAALALTSARADVEHRRRLVGLHFISVDHEIAVTDEDLAELPVGDYGLVIQYTATTD